MARTLDPLQFLLMAMAGWINQRQQQVIEYLQEENRVLREQTGQRRLRFTDDQRRRLAVKAKVLGRRALVDCRSEFFSMDSAVNIAVLPGKRFRGCRVCVDVAHELTSQIFDRS
ncbi:MAG TPA: hypothetical protein VGQ43_00880, partial [Candidatus Udaeobacter sp.]|nr:hypothetical protein [Candidatus Udaeobacter sp.]